LAKDFKNIGYILIFFSIVFLVLLALIKANYDSQSAVLCEEFAKDPTADMLQCPAHKSNTSWLITIAFGVAFLILGAGAYLIIFSQPQFEELKKEFKQIDLSKLDDDGKLVYNIIKEKEGSIFQSELIKETGFSKVKVSRTLDKLEGKGIVERKRRGMTNIIVLR